MAGDDLAVQGGVAGGDAGDVADALAGQREVVRRGVGQPAGDQGGQQVRHVRGARHGAVVLGGRQQHRSRPAGRGERLDQLDRSHGSAAACGVTAQGRPSNSVALAAERPGRSLPAIGWLPTYRSAPGQVDDRGQRRGLDAADVGDHGVVGGLQRGAR